jgi:hypothetical protein
VWIAAASTCGNVVNGGRHGINIAIDGVTSDGLSFKEGDTTFTGMISVMSQTTPSLASIPAANGIYSNIKILNNYMKGNKLTSTYQTGGSIVSKWPQTYDGLEYR